MKTEIAVIGGGPAGLSAAIEAAKNGVKVTLIDENSKAGGQLFKQIHRFFGSEEHLAGTRGFEIGNMLLRDAKKYGVEILLNNVVWGLFPDLRLGIADQNRIDILEPKKVVVATGGSENALSFPGWTLPNIMGAGAAQTLINVNRVLPGMRVVMVGSGNVGLIISYQLVQAGAEVAAVVEALPDIGGYKVHASKIARMGIPILTSHTITSAYGKNFVEKVEIAQLDKDFKIIEESKKELEVDMVCIAVGLRPLAELCWIAGMKFYYISKLGGFVPLHDENMQSTKPGIYVAGDVTGIEEASTAIEEGRIAGIALSMEMDKLAKKPGTKMLTQARERLKALRLGPFGEHRSAAKKSIQKRYYQ